MAGAWVEPGLRWEASLMMECWITMQALWRGWGGGALLV